MTDREAFNAAIAEKRRHMNDAEWRAFIGSQLWRIKLRRECQARLDAIESEKREAEAITHALVKA